MSQPVAEPATARGPLLREKPVASHLKRALSNLLDPALFGLLTVIAIALVTYFPATQMTIESNDQLDSMIPAHSMTPPVWQTFLDLRATAPALDGLSLNMLAFSEFDATRLIFSIFPKYSEISWLYVFDITAIYMSFVFAMHVLSARLSAASMLPTPDRAAIALGGALIALLPHSMAMLAPLVALNLFVAAATLIFTGGRRVTILSLLVLSAFFGDISSGSYIYLGVFLLATLLIGTVAKSWAPAKYAATAILFALIADYRTVYGLLFEEPSQRSTWLDGANLGLGRILDKEYWQAAFSEMMAQIAGQPIHYHYQWNTNQILPLLLSVSIFTVLFGGTVISAIKHRPLALSSGTQRLWGASMTVVAVSIAISGIYGVLSSNMVPLGAWLHLTLQFERVIEILPFLSATAVTFAAGAMFSSLRFPAIKSVAVVISAIAVALNIHEPLKRKLTNLSHFSTAGPTNPFVPIYTVGTVFQRGTFNALKDQLGPGWPSERVMSVGLDPMVALYNDFWTLDGYYYQYPKEWQLAFRTVIAPTLDKMPDKAGLYDGWGSRFGLPILNSADGKIDAPMDACAFAALGGTLLISQYELLDPGTSRLVFDGTVTALTQGLSSTIHLYRPDKSCPALGRASLTSHR